MQTHIPRDEYLGAAPESANGGAEMSKLESALKDFNDYYDRITDVRFGARIGRAAGTPEGNALNIEYGRELQRAENMKRRIENVLGAWNSVKGMIGLGALPVIPLAVAVALTLAIVGVTRAGRSYLRTTEIKLAMREDPELSYEEAAGIVDAATRSGFDRTLDLAQWGLAAFVAVMILKYVRD